MGRFIQHEPCPNCGSRDNLGSWTDGKYCFGCGWRESKDKIEQFKIKMTINDNNNNRIYLPHDTDLHLPLRVKNWLDRYGITKREMARVKMLWCEDKQLLIFPFHDAEGELIGWQGRNFDEDTMGNKKYDSRGSLAKIDVFVNGENNDRLYVVEDMISAIKVGRVADALPLFGSILSKERAVRLAGKYSNLGIWLDYDKRMDAMKYKQNFSHLFKDIRVVVTVKDPKEYTTQQIKNILTES